MSTKAYVKRAVSAGSALGVGAAIAVGAGIMTAPAASAEPVLQPNTVNVAPDGGMGIPPAGPYGTSCTYPVSVATWGNGGAVHFYARNGGGMWNLVGVDFVGSGDQSASAQWTPSNGPGVYQVAATTRYGGDEAPFWESFTNPGDELAFVNVGTGINLGSMCVVLP